MDFIEIAESLFLSDRNFFSVLFPEMEIAFEPAKTIIERYEVRLIVYNPDQEVIEQWIE
jgi:hypothetical protein